MKAVVLKEYGNPTEVLSITQVEKPLPKDNEVLVKIHCTTINDYEWSMVTGKPLIYRLIYGLVRPKHRIPGMELSGIVEAVGDKVMDLSVGDAVFGDISEFGFGAYAEYICIDKKALLKKPSFLSFEDASAAPHAFGLAIQALRDIGGLKKGQQILINGGGGGVGTLGLQLAKAYDCEVTGVDSGDKLDMMKQLGFDHVIDYRKNNFTQNGNKYDIILDCKTSRSASSYLKVLKPEGKYVSIGGTISKLLGVFLWGKAMSLFTSKKLVVLGLKANKGLDVFLDLYKNKKIRTHIDGPHQMEDIPELIEYFGKGEHKGKVVIKVH